MSELTQDFVIRKFQEIATSLGRAPSRRDFIKLSNISARQLEKLFGSNTYSKLAQLSGFKPNSFCKTKTNQEELFRIYARVAREIKRQPTRADWVQKKVRPTADGISKVHFPFSEFTIRFRQFAVENNGFQDILELLHEKRPDLSEPKKLPTSISNPSRYIPPTLLDLDEFKGDAADFENKIQDAFQILGFKVQRLGGPNNPDGIAKRPKNHFAVIFDAKSHAEGYSITSGDRRAAMDYIMLWKNTLNREGIDLVYFSFVARKFTSESVKNIQEIRKSTNITTFLLTTQALFNLAVRHIQVSHDFDHEKLRDLFSKGGLIGLKEIELFLNSFYFDKK